MKKLIVNADGFGFTFGNNKAIFEILPRGFVKSVRGPSGGYVLAKKPFEITLLDIITAVDGEFNLTQCLALGEEYCVQIDECVARRFWDRLQNVIKNYLKKITLEKLVQKQRELWTKADNR